MTVTFTDSGDVRTIEYQGITVSGTDKATNGFPAGWLYQEPKGGGTRTVPHRSLHECLLEIGQRRGATLDQLKEMIDQARAEQFDQVTVAEERKVWVRKEPEAVAENRLAEEANEPEPEAVTANREEEAKNEPAPEPVAVVPQFFAGDCVDIVPGAVVEFKDGTRWTVESLDKEKYTATIVGFQEGDAVPSRETLSLNDLADRVLGRPDEPTEETKAALEAGLHHVDATGAPDPIIPDDLPKGPNDAGAEPEKPAKKPKAKAKK